ncbi:hypothetical protein [Niabella aquatica]
MKFTTIFKTITLCTAFLFILRSCKKANTGENCLPFIKADTLRFNVVDKNSGENLFFPNTPHYTSDQILFLIDDMTVPVKTNIETSSSGQKNFLIAIGSGQKSGIIKGYIDGMMEYTIDYLMKQDRTSGCPAYIFDKIIVNGNQQEHNLKGRVIVLKK